MSRYSYAGNYQNPTNGFFVQHIADDTEDGHFEIWIRDDRASDGSCQPDRKHRMANNHFEEGGDAQECIEQMAEAFEEDYDSYLESR